MWFLSVMPHFNLKLSCPISRWQNNRHWSDVVISETQATTTTTSSRSIVRIKFIFHEMASRRVDRLLLEVLAAVWIKLGLYNINIIQLKNQHVRSVSVLNNVFNLSHVFFCSL